MKHYIYYCVLVVLLFVLPSCSYSNKISKAKNTIDNIVKKYPELVQDSQIIIIDTFISKSYTHDTVISCDSLRHYIQQIGKGSIEFIPINNKEYRVITRIEPDTILKRYLVTFKYIESQNSKLFKELQQVTSQYNKLTGEHKGIRSYYAEREKQFKIYRNYFFIIIFVLVVYATYRIYNRVTQWNAPNLLKNIAQRWRE
jgi:nitrogen fixation/metabolism regulation signal transduction histidine kinase